MGSRRISRRNLFRVNQAGRNQTRTAAAGIADSIGSQTEMRDGSLITTDIQIDLGNATNPANSFATTTVGAAGNRVIGVSASAGTHSDAQLLLLAPINGIVAQAELICVEPPTTGEDNIGVWYADTTGSAGSQLSATTNPVELIPAEAYAAAGDIAVVDDVSADIDGKYIYLVSSGSTAGTYDAGKFILRLHGYTLFNDV